MKRDVQDAGGDGLSVSVLMPCQAIRLSHLFAALSVAVTTGFFARSVQAERIIFGYSGAVTEVVDRGLGHLVSVGDPITGWYSFDSELPDLNPASPNQGRYGPLGPVWIQVGAIEAMTPADATVRVSNSELGDGYSVSRASLFAYGGLEFSEFSLGVGNSEGILLSSDSLPLVPPDGSLFDESYFVLLAISPEGEDVLIRGTIDRFTIVPEPMAVLPWLVAVALFCPRRGLLGCRIPFRG